MTMPHACFTATARYLRSAMQLKRSCSTLHFPDGAVFFTRVDRSRREEVLGFMHDNLHTDEVIRSALNVFRNVPRVRCIDEYYSKLMEENLTVMGLDMKSKKVVAAIIAYPYTDKEPEYKTHYRNEVLRDFPKMVHHFGIMDVLWRKALLEQSFGDLQRRGPVLFGKHGCVAAGLRQRTILQGILREVISLARQEGFKAVIGDPTGRFSRKSMEIVGFHLITEVVYADYEDGNGVRIFRDIMDPQHKSLALLGIAL